MLRSLKKVIGSNELFSYNIVRRDRWIAEQASHLPAKARVLDVGAGSSPYRALFDHCQYQNQDFSALKNEQLRHGGYSQIDYVCDAAAIPVEDNSFDAVLCSEVLEHHPYPAKLIQEISRILSPGGILMLTAPLGSGIHQEPYHFYGGYTPWWYEKFLHEANFENIRIEANEGSLRFFAQESIRFIRTTRPFGLGMPFFAEIIWAPMWVMLVPILGFGIPVLCKFLDPFDREQRFTVGYHVTATCRQLGG